MFVGLSVVGGLLLAGFAVSRLRARKDAKQDVQKLFSYIVYRSPCLEQRADRARLPGPMECGGTIPASQEGRGCILGALASVGGHLVAIAYVRDSDWLDVGQSGPPDAGQPEIRELHGEDTVGDKSHAGTRAHERAGSAYDSDTCPDLTAAQRKAVKAFDLGRWLPTLLSSRS